MGIEATDQPGPSDVCHEVLQEIENEVDLSYYYLNNAAFIALLPVLEVNHLLKIETLNLAANAIDDDAIIELCDTLLNVHNTSLQRLSIDETMISDRGVLALVDTMTRITSLHQVSANNLKLKPEVRAKLEAQCQKNKVMLQDKQHLDNMYKAAKKRDDYD